MDPNSFVAEFAALHQVLLPNEIADARPPLRTSASSEARARPIAGSQSAAARRKRGRY
jgi:hypothetical protein